MGKVGSVRANLPRKSRSPVTLRPVLRALRVSESEVDRHAGRRCDQIAAALRASAWMHLMHLYPSKPLVALVFPIAAARLSQEIHLGQVLHLLVAELHGRVDADRRAVVGH